MLLLSACSGGGPAADEPDTAARIEAALSDRVATGGAMANLRAVLVSVDGEPVVEEYYDTRPGQHWAVQSVTKSVTATLVGIAVEEGALHLDSTLAELLPDRRHLMSGPVRATTLRRLLTMTAGFTEEGAPDEEWILRDSVAPVDRALRRATGPSDFGYSNAGVQVLSAVLTEATGTPVLDFAQTRARLSGRRGRAGPPTRRGDGDRAPALRAARPDDAGTDPRHLHGGPRVRRGQPDLLTPWSRRRFDNAVHVCHLEWYTRTNS